MALVVTGRIAPLDRADPDATFAGRIWVSDDGLVERVTRRGQRAPAGFGAAPVVDVGAAVVYPGLIDLHSHLAYNTLPLWAEPSQATPFLHHDDWTDEASYAPNISWPAWTLAQAEPEALLAYVEVKAVVGGTTSIQGSPRKNRPRDGWVVRNIEDETLGTGNRNLIYASALTETTQKLAQRAQAMSDGAGFIYHCAEGHAARWRQPSSPRRRGPAASRNVSSPSTATPSAPTGSPNGNTSPAPWCGRRSPTCGSTGRPPTSLPPAAPT